MQRLNSRSRHIIIIVLVLVFIAALCRKIGYFTEIRPLEAVAALLRSGIYISMFAAWGISIRKRIMQKQTRKNLTDVAILLIFWMTLRTVKYSVLGENITLARYCWYLYYIPMLLVPLESLFAILALGKPENYQTDKRLHTLWIFTDLLVLLVLTNDLHQQVFQFMPGKEWVSSYCTHEWGYVLCVVWIFGLGITAYLVIVFAKCRILEKKKTLLPLVPFSLIFVYTILYLLDNKILHVIAGDMTTVLCLLIICIFETCIQCGLIQVNTHYNELFDAATISAQIVDEQYNPYQSSHYRITVPVNIMKRAENKPVLLEGGILLSNAPIRGGHVLWQEDISSLLSLQKQLDETNKLLEESTAQLQIEYENERKRLQIEETNRLYEDMERYTAGQIRLITDLLHQLPKEENKQKARQILCRIAVIGAYLKRRSNLIFVASQQQHISAAELQSCLNESARGISLGGGRCIVSCEMMEDFIPQNAMRLYDFFEEVVETAGTTASFYITVKSEKTCCMTISVVCPENLSGVIKKYPDSEIEQEEESGWNLKLCMARGGTD